MREGRTECFFLSYWDQIGKNLSTENRFDCSGPILLSIEAKPEAQKEEGSLAKVT